MNAHINPADTSAYAIVCGRIRARLDKTKLNMKSASLASGLNETAVRDILNRGRRPTIDTLEKLCRPLRCSIAYLVGAEENPDTELLALGVEFCKAWAAERAAFVADTIGNSTPEIEAAHDRCGDLARQIQEHRPITLEGVKVAAMVWGWLHYLSATLGAYEGDEEGNGIDERAQHAVMTFLLKDVAA